LHHDAVTVAEMVSILFIVRLVDAMHRVAYATFLSYSFMEELRKKLSVLDLELELEVNATRGSYQQEPAWSTIDSLGTLMATPCKS
jgi:hypothetical protein